MFSFPIPTLTMALPWWSLCQEQSMGMPLLEYNKMNRHQEAQSTVISLARNSSLYEFSSDIFHNRTSEDMLLSNDIQNLMGKLRF